MILDTISIVGSISALAILLLSWIFNPFRRNLCNTPSDQAIVENPPLSLVIIVRGNAQSLETSLPLWLAQQYSADLQIVVVTEEGDRNADEVLKRLEADKRIYTTFTPRTSRYMSRNKLAVTLGVKASCHQLVMLVDADCRPASNSCLSLLTKFYHPSKPIIMPFSRYEESCREFYQFEHLHRALYYMYFAINSRAYACNSNCLLFNKTTFMKGQGFLGNLHLTCGEYDFLVNRYSLKKATTVVVDPLAQIIKQSPSRRKRQINAIEALETRHHLKRSFPIYLLYTTDQFVLYISYLSFLCIFLWGAFCEHWILFGLSIGVFLIFIFLRITLAKRVLKILGITIKTWLIPFYELRIIWHNLMVTFLYKMTNKIEFTSHKL